MKNRIGIVGGGQLGRMLALAAKPLGFRVTVLDPTPESPASQVAEQQIVADFANEQAIRELAQASDYLTFEIELANAGVLDELALNGLRVNPSAKTLDIIKDKLRQKEFLRTADLPTPDFLAVSSAAEIERVAQEFGYPVVLKARRDAYDGRGNAVINQPSDIPQALEKLAGRELYAERFIEFEKELAVMVARSLKGEIVTYPVVETIHKNNICHTVLAPAPAVSTIKDKAEELARRVMEKLKGAGVFGIEMFLSKGGEVLINELAPRVHNSGHYTIEACTTSQFEQHVRAVTGLPLGQTDIRVPQAVMVNILGRRSGSAKPEGLDKALALPHTAVHIYGKLETRPERKMGHITCIGNTLEETLARAKRAREYISI